MALKGKTHGFRLDKLLLGSLVLLLDADVLLVEGEHALLDVFGHVLPRQRRAKIATKELERKWPFTIDNAHPMARSR